jgi:hypothetical protein
VATLEAFYDPGPGSGFVVSTPAQVDELLDRMVSESAKETVGLMAQVGCKEGDGWGSGLQFGVRAAKCGFVAYMGASQAEGSAISDNGGTSPEMIAYDYQYNEREVPSNAEVSLDTVRQAVHDYVASGGARPAGVRWREVSY